MTESKKISPYSWMAIRHYVKLLWKQSHTWTILIVWSALSTVAALILGDWLSAIDTATLTVFLFNWRITTLHLAFVLYDLELANEQAAYYKSDADNLRASWTVSEDAGYL